MLQSLHVHNFALIEDARVDFSGGFTVFTGETGAGKSIILAAVNLRGVGESVKLNVVLTSVVMVALAIIILIGAWAAVSGDGIGSGAVGSGSGHHHHHKHHAKRSFLD